MTTIVVAALALLVLVVLALVFTGRMGNFAQGVDKVGTCKQACNAAGYSGDPSTTDIPATGNRPTCDATYTEIPGVSQDFVCCCK